MNTESVRRLDKRYESAQSALSGMNVGASIMVGGFAGHGVPAGLVRAVIESGIHELTIICQGAGEPDSPLTGLNNLVDAGLVKKIISPLPYNPRVSGPVKERWEAGDLELEVQPAGVLTERIRAGGAGIGGLFLPVGAGTRFADGREIRQMDGHDHVFHSPLKADFALIRATSADTLGNLVYTGTQRNWNPIMAMAALVTVAEVDELVPKGELDPERVITPAIFVQRLVVQQL